MSMRKLTVIFAALAVLCSCNGKGGEDWSGMEYITFDVEGRVTDVKGNPLEGIAVATSYGDTVRTNYGGVYLVAGSCSPMTAVNVNFIDTDKEANGGAFIKFSRRVELEYTGGAHGPYVGKYEARGIDVTMMKESVITPVEPEGGDDK